MHNQVNGNRIGSDCRVHPLCTVGHIGMGVEGTWCRPGLSVGGMHHEFRLSGVGVSRRSDPCRIGGVTLPEFALRCK